MQVLPNFTLFSDTSKTCKLLCAASRSRSVWRVQYQRVSDSYDTPLNVMDGTATYAELERDTLHWARVQQDWVFRPKQPTQRLVCECPAVQIHLVPGGRWLLATDEDPFLYFHDLDSPNGQRHILIRLQDNQDKRVTSFVVDETNTTPYNVDMLIALNHEPNRVFFFTVLLHSNTHPSQTISSGGYQYGESPAPQTTLSRLTMSRCLTHAGWIYPLKWIYEGTTLRGVPTSIQQIGALSHALMSMIGNTRLLCFITRPRLFSGKRQP